MDEMIYKQAVDETLTAAAEDAAALCQAVYVARSWKAGTVSRILVQHA